MLDVGGEYAYRTRGEDHAWTAESVSALQHAVRGNSQERYRAFAKILNAANVKYAVLGRNESCTGDSARRAGREDIFFGLASQNVEILNEVAPKRIVTTCPHCLHTIKNEYPAFGGNYQIIHHTQLINELVGAGKIQLQVRSDELRVTFHDPCYLGRANEIYAEPRSVIGSLSENLVEPVIKLNSYLAGLRKFFNMFNLTKK